MKANLSPGRSLDPVSHDGIHDALTFLPAPSYFYEHLYREISIIERSREHLTLINVVITPKAESIPIRNFETSIINFAKALNRSIRQSDLAARMGCYQFLLAIHSFPEAPKVITGSSYSMWCDEEFTFSYSSSHHIDTDEVFEIQKSGNLSKLQVVVN
jgi:GGDEF domain-containing protein